MPTPLRSIRDRAGRLVESTRQGLARSTLSLFDHAPYPLEGTLEHDGDPGLLGPDSVSWRVLADPAAIVGGLRGLLIQAAHPEVVSGVDQHSRYREDPLGRLSRTSSYVTATTFGATAEVEKAVAQVRRAHRIVRGVSSRGVHYDASDPQHAAWVHNALTVSFLDSNQAFAERKLSEEESDRFTEEQSRIGALLGADPMPVTAARLRSWVAEHPDIDSSPEMREVIEFLSDPPLAAPVKLGYSILFEAAVSTIPERLRDVLGLRSRPGARRAGRVAVTGLRWALGYSPSWALALHRTGVDLPAGMFRQLAADRIAS